MRLLFSYILILSFRLCAGEVVLSEDFEKLDLKTLPAGSIAGKDVSIVTVEGEHSKVLKIKNAKNGTSAVSFTLNLMKVAGHTVRVSVQSQFPGAFEPVAGKTWGRPRLQIAVKGKDGKDAYAGKAPEPNKPEWQPLWGSILVPMDAKQAVVMLKVDIAEAEAFFDNLAVEIDPDPKAPTPAIAAAPPVPDTPAAKAAKAPKKALDDGGILFGPEIAVQLQKRFAKPSATPNTYLFAGAGLPNKEYEGGRPPANWKVVPLFKECAGPAIGPLDILGTIGDYLATQKPEVVVLFAEAACTRKLSDTETYDWSDAIRLCLRVGAIPVLAVPPASGDPEKDRLRGAMLEAAADALCPAMDLKASSAVPRNFAELALLLDKHVFCRVPMDATVKGKGTGKETEE